MMNMMKYFGHKKLELKINFTVREKRKGGL